jgi:hypothetical protein
MKISLKTVALCASLLIGMQPMLKAERQLCEEKKCIFKKDVAEALIHLVTNGVAYAGTGAMALTGLVLDETIKTRAEINTYYAGTVTGFVAGLCTIYKMPQWTDTHILRKDAVRSQAQNVLVFLSRILFGGVGVFIGESLNMEPAVDAPVAEATVESSACAND